MPDYKFEFGNSTVGPIGFTAWVRAKNKPTALRVLRARLDAHAPGGDLELQGGREYISVFISIGNITEDDIVDVEP